MNYNLNRKKCLKLTYGNKKNFLLFLILNILINVTEVYSIITLGNIFGYNFSKLLFKNSFFNFLIPIVILLLLMLLKRVIKSNLINTVSENLTIDAYLSMLNADINELEKEEVKDAVNNIQKNSNHIAKEYIGKEILGFYELITGIVVLAFSGLFVDTIIDLICIVSLAFYYISIKTTEFSLKRSVRKLNELECENINYIKDTFTNIKDIKLKNGNEYEYNIFSKKLNLTKKLQNKKDLKDLISSHFMSLIYMSLCVLSVISLIRPALSSINKNPVSIGNILYFIIVIPILYNRMYRCLHKKIELSNIDIENNQLNILYSLHSESKTEPITSLDDIISLEFKNVSFVENDTNKELFSNISFEIGKNEKIAILCESKDTKDALYTCLNKLNKIKTGSYEINGSDVNKIRTPYLRELITSLDYNTNVLNKSIKENIIFPNELDEYKYNDALNKTGLKEMLSFLPNGEETIIDFNLIENYNDIINRIIFANAIYKDSKIYLLNDVSKDLDFDTEKYLFDKLNNLKNKMIINITDKVYLLSHYDKILIVEDGKQIEYGKYDDLMADKTSELYKRVKSVKIKRKIKF